MASSGTANRQVLAASAGRCAVAGAFCRNVRVVVHADKGSASRRHGGRPRGSRRDEPGGNGAGGERGSESSFSLDLLELGPGRARERIGEYLDVVRAAGRVRHGVDERLVLQNALNVERQVLVEPERLDGQPVAAANRGGERLRGGAQQVGVRIGTGSC